jgi:hypothetical protein
MCSLRPITSRLEPTSKRVGPADNTGILARIRQRGQEVLHAIEPCALLVVGLDDRPRRISRVGVEEHGFLGFGVIAPLVQRLTVDGRQLPLLQRLLLAAVEAAKLLVLRDREPVLEQQDAGAHHHLLDFRCLAHELEVLVGRTEAHHPLNTGAVVPGPVEQNHLACRRQVLDVTLEVPLRLFAVGGLVQRHHARTTRIEVLGKPLDGAALAGRVPAFEQHDDLLAGFLDPFLHLEQFDLKLCLLLFIVLAADLALVGVLAIFEHAADLFCILAALMQ